MKKLTGLMLLIAGATFFALGAKDCKDCDDRGCTSDVTGHTFFAVRPEFQPASPEQESLFRGRELARDCGIGGAVQIVPFGGRSTDECGLARYFMFCGKSKLTVNSDQTQLPDVNPIHFGVQCETGDYSSWLTFSPRRTTAGVFLQYRQFLGWNECCERQWWIDIAAPIQWVKNDVRICEENRMQCTTNEDNSNATVEAGFAGEQWTPALDAGGGVIDGQGPVQFNFGKINICDSLDKTRLADLQVRLGTNYVCTECCHAEGYLGIWIPTGNRPKGEFVFEPIVGQNFHVGIMTGGSMGYQMWCGDCDREVWFEFAINSIYSFKNTQTRSFDLKNRPWSRYMLAFADQAAANNGIVTPGINLFTRQVRVSPRFQHNYTMALVYNQCSFQGEIGYNFWARQAEKVKLKDCWVEGPAIAALDGNNELIPDDSLSINPTQFGINRLSNIGDNNCGDLNAFPPDIDCEDAMIGEENVCAAQNVCDQTGEECGAIDNPCRVGCAAVVYSDANRIKVTDLDLNSAAHPGAMSHTIYGALGYCWDECDWPMLVGVGGSYEFTGVNTALNRWLVWGKFSVSF